MKKLARNKSKRYLAILLSLVVIVTAMIPLGVFADEDNVAGADTGIVTEGGIVLPEAEANTDTGTQPGTLPEDAGVTTTPEDLPEDEKVAVIADSQSNAGEQLPYEEPDSSTKPVKGKTALGALSDPGKIEVSLGGSPVEDGAVITDWDMSAIKMLSVKVSNIGGTNNTDNVLTITVPEGLEIISYPKLDDGTIGSFLTAVTPPAIDPIGSVLHGDLVYAIDGASSITFNVQVRPDSYRFYGAHTVPNPITATLVNSEGTQNSDFTVGITGTFSITFHNYGNITDFYTMLDNDFSDASIDIITAKGNPASIANTFYSKVAYTITYPASAELTGLSNLSGRSIPNDKLLETSFGGIRGVKHDASAHTVTFYYKNINFHAVVVGLKLNFKASLGATVGSSYKYGTTKIDYTTYDGKDGTKSVSNSGANIHIVPSGGNPNTIGATATNRNIAPTPYNFGSTTEMLPGYSVVGRYTFTNDKGRDLTDQVIRYDFPRELNVRGFYLPSVSGVSLGTTVYYKKYDDPVIYERTITQTGNSYNVIKITPAMLTNLDTGDILEYVYANCGNFPTGFYQSATSSDGCFIFGNLRIEDQDSASYFDTKLTVTGDGASPVATSCRVTVATAQQQPKMEGYVAEFGSKVLTGSVEAGHDIPVWGTFNTYNGLNSGSIQRMRNPVFYAIIPEGFTVDLNTVQVKRGTATGASIEYEATIINYTNQYGQEPKEVLVIQTKNCIAGQVTESFATLANVIFGFTYSTSTSINTLSAPLNTMIFAGPEAANSALQVRENMRFLEGSSSSSTYTIKDSYDFNGNSSREDYLSTVATSANNYINVVEKKELAIGAKIKLDSEADSAYRTYDNTVASKVVFTPDTLADYQVTIENRSDKAVNDLAVYVPVPKKGLDLGSFFQVGGASPWNMTMEDGLSNTIIAGDNVSLFNIEYASGVTGSGDYNTAEYVSANEVTLWADVNMTKITISEPLPVGSKTTINFKYNVSVSESEASLVNGQDNIFNPYYYVDYDLAKGSYPGAKVAATLQLGSIQGMVFIDTDKNGFKGGTELYYTGADVTVTLTGGALVEALTTTTNAEGKYAFNGLNSASNYEVSFSLPAGYVYTNQNLTAESDINSDIVRTGANAGKAVGVDTSESSSRSVNAGFAINTAPVITVNTITIRANQTFTPGVVSIIDDFDGTITYSADTHLASNNVPTGNPKAAGTYEVTYHATDTHGLQGTASQKVKINSLPYVVSHADWTLPVASAPTKDDLASRVDVKYDVATDTIGQDPIATSVTTTVSALATAPSAIGKYSIPVAAGNGTIGNIVTGSADYYLTLKGAPEVSAVTTSGTYLSEFKTNKNVTISAVSAPGLTIKYRKGISGVWTDLTTVAGAAGELPVSTEELATYQFCYADGSTVYDGAGEVTGFTTDINKGLPTLKKGEVEITDTTYYGVFAPVATAAAVTNSTNSVAASYTLNGGSSTTYTGSTLDFGTYVFTLTDSYGNVKTYNFVIDHLWTVTFAAGTYGSLTSGSAVESSFIVNDIPSGTTLGAFGVTIPTPTPNTGYRFNDWTATTPTAITAVTADVTYTANFVAKEYTVNYNANGGTGASVSPATVTWGSIVALPSLTKTGYTTAGSGWEKTAPSPTVAAIANKSYGEYVSSDAVSAITLSARFNAKPVTVDYNANGGTAGSVTTTTGAFDSALGSANVPDDTDTGAPSRTGYSFSGWATTNSAISADFDESTVLNEALIGTTAANSDAPSVTVYAVWEANEYEVTFADDGVSGITNWPTPATFSAIYDSGYGDVLDKTAARTGYTFVGWTTSAGILGTLVTSASIVNTASNHELHALWAPNPVTITYHANYGSDATYTQGVTYDKNAALSANTFTRAGYTFTGWSTEAGIKSAVYADKEAFTPFTEVADIDLYAQWDIVTYSISYNLDGGANAAGNPDSYTVSASPVSIADPSKSGYTFDGWTATGGANISSATTSAKIPAGATGDITFTAHWTVITVPPVTYTVTFKDHDGSVIGSPQTVEKGSAATAPAAPARTGYEFTGWDKSYSNVTSDLTITAQYDKLADQVKEKDKDKNKDKKDKEKTPVTPTVTPTTPPVTPAVTTEEPLAVPEVTDDEPEVTPEPEDVISDTEEPESGSVDDNTSVDVDGGTTFTPEQQEMIRKNPDIEAFITKNVPILGIGNADVPLFGLTGVNSWGLINVILAALSLIFALFSVLRALARRRSIEFGSLKGGVRTPFIITGLGLAVVNMVLFFVVEDTSATMTLFDGWSVLSVVLFAGVIVMNNLSFRKPAKAAVDAA